MEKSTSIKNIAAALIMFHVKVDTISKDATNPFFKSKYASLSNILDGINDPLNEAGLSFVQFPVGKDGLTTILMHGESGEFIQGNYEMSPVKDDPQGRGSALTYQRRYAISAILGLNIDDDDDGNHASHVGQKSADEKVTDNKPWLNKDTKEFQGAVAKLRLGQTTIEKIKTVMRVSKEVEALLKERTQLQTT